MRHKVWFVWIVLFSAICFLYKVSNLQLTYAKAQTKNDTFNNIDTYLQSCVKNAHIPSMSITIVNKDKVLFSQNYGDCKNCDVPFLLGSVSKSFTAVCIMQLVEQNKIDLNAAIAVYLPNATDGDKITVSQLLNHTSGLGEHQNLKNYKIITKQGIHNYANVNYSLLGEIIETVSGQPYNTYITESLFAPLGLSHTAAAFDKSIENGLINGYTNYWGFHIKNNHKYPLSKNAWITVPAGYLSASTNDLGKYLQMYLNGGNNIISQQSIDTMFYGDTVYIEDAIPYWYGYGWAMVRQPFSEPVLRHSGLIETGTSCIFILPEREIGIAITANVNDYFVTNNMMDQLGWGVVAILLGDPANVIKSNAYILSHFQIDLIMFLIVAAAILFLCLIPKYINRIKHGKKPVFSIFIYLFMGILVLLLVPIFFATPLWVAKSFVPDVFITVLISATIFFTNAFIRIIILIRNCK